MTYAIFDALNDSREAAYSNVRNLALRAANDLDLIIRDNEIVLARLVQRPGIRALDPHNCDPVIDEFISLHPEYTTLAVRDFHANLVCSFIHLPLGAGQVGGLPWFIEGLRSEGLTVSNAFFGVRSGRWVSVLTFPVRDSSGNVSGLLDLPLDLLTLQERVLRPVPGDTLVAVLDRDFRFLMRSAEPEKWIGNALPPALVDMYRGRTEGFDHAPDVDGVSRLWAFVPVPGTGWRVSVGVPESEVLSRYRTVVTQSVVISIIVSVMAIALAWRIAARIVRAIRELARTSTEIATGNSVARVRIAGPSEVEEVAQQFNSMLDSRERQREERMALASHYRTLIQHISDVVLLTAADGRIVEANESAVAAYGWNADELRRLNIRDLCAPDSLSTMGQQLEASASREGALFEAMQLRRDGTRFPVEASARFIEIEGRLYRQSFIRDITKREQAKAQLRESEERLKLALQSANQGLYDLNVRTGAVVVNPELAIMLGYDPVEFHDTSATWIERMHPEDKDRAVQRYQDCIAGRIPVFHEEFRQRTASGAWKWVLSLGRVVERDAEGRPLRMLGTVTDITERKLAEQSLRESEQRFRKYIENASDIIYEVTPLGIITYVSPNWPALMGEPAAEAVGEAFEHYVHPDDVHLCWEFLEGVLNRKAPLVSVDFRLLRRDGSIRWHSSTGAALRDNAGNAVGYVGISRDITERKRADLELERISTLRETISRCNAALVRFNDEHKLLDEMCRILVEVQGYRLVWIGLAENDSDKTVSVQAAAGVATDYLKALTIRWGDDAFGRGSTGTAIRTGKTQITRDVSTAQSFMAWKKQVEQWSIRTAISLPLVHQGKAFGVLSAYSQESNIFDADEVKALDEFASDLTYGILMIRAQKERDQARENLEEALLKTIGAIALTVEKRDPYTAGHQSRVAKLAVVIAGELGWGPERIEGLRLGASIHDIGKIQIPADILNRPGRLSAHEFGVIKVHPEVGYEIISGISFPWPVKEIVLQHHERLDGTGYPKGLKGDDITMEARVVAVADVVEAMASHRPYRPALGIEAALKEIERGRSTAYDIAVVDACLRLFREKNYKIPD
jgi:PAS domain S-box-containing protein